MANDNNAQDLPTRSATENDHIVSSWAAANSVPSVRAFAVYDAWYSQGLVAWSEAELRQELGNFFIHVRDTEQYSVRSTEALESQRTAWALEAVKHVALINLAGIAGILTLQTTDKAKASLFWPLSLFLAGAVLTALTFTVAAVLYAKRADLERARAFAALNANGWQALVEAHNKYVSGHTGLRTLFRNCVLLIISAFASTFIGAVALAIIQY
ncbi:hypothetical protein GHR37_26385 [Achromobacter xylosoxidans]|nr:hypothetical protein [Achromobacter xylosoxidans]